ncbi:putative regulatory protein (CxxC_CxxC_SSSS) [uncultured Desulfobacterium sp.]|uniref:Putative regulatory protein (CxxC_CxxC_SSSS) n=1 Tax=uncultured Desulfobacterium sp. TaxID=201089 RepID=A0A445MW06_9BACT|nr:putative regulatory protein (CxxC_CxxC_SSSS) [uncultured Desulfobacterium sp.]
MPIFEFKCLECGNVFEKLFINSNEEVDLNCPDCRSADLERVVSRTNYSIGAGAAGNQAKITEKTCGGGSNRCMTLDLPGPSR